MSNLNNTVHMDNVLSTRKHTHLGEVVDEGKVSLLQLGPW